MPSAYPADPTATQSPSAAPYEDALPTVNLPIDTDPPNGSTYEQGYKVLGDWVAWCKKPFAKASAWAQAVQKWQNARRQDRFQVDHMGYPGGDLQVFAENWTGQETLTASGGLAFVNTQLKGNAELGSTASGGVTVTPPDANHPSSFLRLALGTGGADFSQFVGNRIVTLANTQGVVMEGRLMTGAQTNQHKCVWGMVNPFAAGWDTITAGFVGATFYKTDTGGALWNCAVGDGTNLATATGVFGVAANTTYKFRIEYLGSGVSDDAAEAVRFYINGSLMATISSAMPSAAAAPFVGPVFSSVRTVAGSTFNTDIGPYRIITNLA